jgi:hypothetical protein
VPTPGHGLIPNAETIGIHDWGTAIISGKTTITNERYYPHCQRALFLCLAHGHHLPPSFMHLLLLDPNHPTTKPCWPQQGTLWLSAQLGLTEEAEIINGRLLLGIAVLLLRLTARTNISRYCK